MKLTLIIFLILLSAVHLQGYKILFSAADSGSHVIMNARAAQLFRERGHDVALFIASNVKLPGDVEKMNLPLIRYNTSGPTIEKIPEVRDAIIKLALTRSLFDTKACFDIQHKYMLKQTEMAMNDKVTMKKMKDAHFDFMVADPIMLSSLYVAYKFSIPFAVLSVKCWDNYRRVPTMPSYVPVIMTSFSDEMTFTERFINFWLTPLPLMIDLAGPDMTKKYIPNKPAMGYFDLTSKAQLCFEMRDTSIDFVRPSMPDLISVGSIMGQPSKSLDSEWQEFMDSSNEGVILMSFGSIVGDLPAGVIEKLLEGLRPLKQRVIFKHGKNLPNAPGNVKVTSWMPQNDLLAHPNMKLFVTHCGMNSLIEAVYHGVPMLAVPFFFDQHSNSAIVKSRGLGEILQISEFTPNELTEKINHITSSEIYLQNARKRSAIYRDVQASGLHDPVFWVEHVLKYGGEHLRASAYEMSNFTYYMIDVILASFIVFLVCCVFIVCSCKLCLRRCCAQVRDKSKND